MNDTCEKLAIGIADSGISVPGEEYILKTSGLGSCVGIVIYDLSRQVAGMSHIMLPDSTQSSGFVTNRDKYADTAIPDLIEKITSVGARRFDLKAKIAGGSQMFKTSSSNNMLQIGPRNVESVLVGLSKHKIPLIAKDVGGDKGRTIEFDPNSGKLRLRMVGKSDYYI